MVVEVGSSIFCVSTYIAYRFSVLEKIINLTDDENEAVNDRPDLSP
jgi:hypothetical protein